MNNKGLLGFGVILALGFIIAVGSASEAFYNSKTLDNAVSVAGSAQQIIDSDTVKWQASFSRTVSLSDLKTGSEQMKNDLAAVLVYIKQSGINEKNVTINPVTVMPVYQPSKDFYGPGNASGYIIAQQIVVNSSEVDKVTKLAQDSTTLLNQGIIFTSQPVEYYYSKLNDLKIDLLAKATENARARAEKIAESSGGKIGKIKSADMGVFQITAVNSTDISDYGSYDTSARQKSVMAVVRTSFLLE
jgi:hypothetical protein